MYRAVTGSAPGVGPCGRAPRSWGRVRWHSAWLSGSGWRDGHSSSVVVQAGARVPGGGLAELLTLGYLIKMWLLTPLVWGQPDMPRVSQGSGGCWPRAVYSRGWNVVPWEPPAQESGGRARCHWRAVWHGEGALGCTHVSAGNSGPGYMAGCPVAACAGGRECGWVCGGAVGRAPVCPGSGGTLPGAPGHPSSGH